MGFLDGGSLDQSVDAPSDRATQVQFDDIDTDLQRTKGKLVEQINREKRQGVTTQVQFGDIDTDLQRTKRRQAEQAYRETLQGVAAAGTITLGLASGSPTVTSIVSVMAVVTATKAMATKSLLEDPADYSLGAGNILTMATDQSLNTLIVTFKGG